MSKDFLMNQKLQLDKNKLITMLCLVEMMANVPKKKNSEEMKSLKLQVPSEEPKTILPLAHHLQNQLKLISLKLFKISLIPEPLLLQLLPEEKLDMLFSKKDKLIIDMLWVLSKVLSVSLTIQLLKMLLLLNSHLIPQNS